VKCAAEHRDIALDVLVDMLRNSRFDAEEIDREKGVIVEEMNMYFDTPRDFIGGVYETLLWGDQPLGRDIIGTKETVRAATRETFTSYLDRWYKPSRTVLGVAGRYAVAVPLAENERRNQLRLLIQGDEKELIPDRVIGLLIARQVGLLLKNECPYLVGLDMCQFQPAHPPIHQGAARPTRARRPCGPSMQVEAPTGMCASAASPARYWGSPTRSRCSSRRSSPRGRSGRTS